LLHKIQHQPTNSVDSVLHHHPTKSIDSALQHHPTMSADSDLQHHPSKCVDSVNNHICIYKLWIPILENSDRCHAALQRALQDSYEFTSQSLRSSTTKKIIPPADFYRLDDLFYTTPELVATLVTISQFHRKSEPTLAPSP